MRPLCSGDMYASVPSIAAVLLICPCSRERATAIPKSVIFTVEVSGETM
jgi:hypothetical protein